MSIKDYKVNKYGMTPCKILRNFDRYQKDEIAGFRPQFIPALEEGKWVEAREDLIGSDSLEEGKEAETVSVAGHPAAKPTVITTEDKNAGDVVIPDDWQTVNHLKRIAAAKKIADARGMTMEGNMTDDMAKVIIQDELDRRATISGDAPAAPTSKPMPAPPARASIPETPGRNNGRNDSGESPPPPPDDGKAE